MAAFLFLPLGIGIGLSGEGFPEQIGLGLDLGRCIALRGCSGLYGERCEYQQSETMSVERSHSVGYAWDRRGLVVSVSIARLNLGGRVGHGSHRRHCCVYPRWACGAICADL